MVQHFGSPYIPEHFVSNSILGQPVDLIAATGQSLLVALGEPFVTFFSPYPLKPTVMHYYSPIKSHGHGHIILFQNQIPCLCIISSFGFPPHIMDSIQYLMKGVREGLRSVIMSKVDLLHKSTEDEEELTLLMLIIIVLMLFFC